jgi:hypothetical protein
VKSKNVPRIRIAPTLTNDIHVMLQRLPFSTEMASFVADRRRFLHDYRGELRFLDQLGRAHIKRLRHRPTDADAETSDISTDQSLSPLDPGVSSIVERRTAILR